MDNFIVEAEDQSSLGEGWKNVTPFKFSRQKRKEKRKCTGKKRKIPWPFLYKRRAG